MGTKHMTFFSETSRKNWSKLNTQQENEYAWEVVSCFASCVHVQTKLMTWSIVKLLTSQVKKTHKK